MIVFGCYAKSKEAQRRKEIDEACKAAEVESARFPYPDFLDAAAAAIIQGRKGNKVVIVGDLSDLTSPEKHNEEEWTESFLAYLDRHSIVFVPVKGKVRRVRVEPNSRTSIIRGYQKAMEGLEKLMQKRLRQGQVRVEGRGYLCGRPPYGYFVKEGEFCIHPIQSEAVKRIFKHIRDGESMAALLTELREKFTQGGIKEGKPEFWDKRKVRRILKHASMYCLGEYRSNSGHIAKLPELAFLPKDWADTDQRRASQARVPSPAGGGTLPSAKAHRR